MNFLVTGATGNVGGLVVDRLLDRGERPRILARDEAKARARFGQRVDVFTGDLADISTLAPPLRGVDALLLLNSGPELAARDAAAAAAAKSAGVSHLVKLSSYDAGENVGTGIWHLQGENAIRAAGIPFTFVRPSGFMSNALFWAKPIHAEGVVRGCTGDGKIPFIHPRDIADVATEALLSSSLHGKTLTITGPEALSYAEMLAKIGRVIGKQLRHESISEDEESRKMERMGDSPEIIAAHLSIYRAIRTGRLAKPTATVRDILHRDPISFDQWIQENLPAFSGSAQAA
jgi:uncharacterized protein YbjT (DUF2867 family)